MKMTDATLVILENKDLLPASVGKPMDELRFEDFKAPASMLQIATVIIYKNGQGEKLLKCR